MIQAVLPSMRERRTGCIVNVTSIAGRIATPNQIPYSASKHALAAASEALAHEVAAFGVRVAIIEPGVIQTAIFENSASATRYDKTSPYRQIMRRNGKLFAAGFRNPGQPDTVAAAILEAITTDRPRLRYPWASTRRGSRRGGHASATRSGWPWRPSSPTEEYNARFKRYFGIERPVTSAPFLAAVALLAQEVLQLAHQLVGVDAVGQALRGFCPAASSCPSRSCCTCSRVALFRATARSHWARNP
jgi:hypothetical protein